MENLIQEVYSAVVNGNASEVKENVQFALDNGIEAETINFLCTGVCGI